MGNAFDKDGWATKAVEVVPGGGLFTAPFHAGAGNAVHATQAAIGGLSSLATTVAAGPLSGVVVKALTTGSTTAIFDGVGMSDDKKVQAKQLSASGNHQAAAMLISLSIATSLPGNTRQLSAESGGRRCFKSVHGTYMRAYPDTRVDLSNQRQAWEQWYLEDWGGKVVFKAIHSPGRFLRANPDNRVDLVDRPQSWEQYVPFKNKDGSWSFLSFHGTWLSAREDGSISLVKNCDSWEHFYLERW